MKTIVLYDSQYGNTQQIAQAIANQLGSPEEVALLQVSEMDPAALNGRQLLIIGSPTQRFMATPALMAWLQDIPREGLQGMKVATFDTRLTEQQIQATPVLKWFVRKSSYAAWWLAKQLKHKGGTLLIPPEGFFVASMEGPLLPGELERAATWGRKILSNPYLNRSLRDT